MSPTPEEEARQYIDAALEAAGMAHAGPRRREPRRRSDDYRFAVAGIPARTLPSYNMHTDYHRPQDEARPADGDHMTAVIEAAARAVHLLSTSPRHD